MEPFLKWPGGKRWLYAARPDLFAEIKGRYIEPFLGGGAVFFALEPAPSVVSDINRDLVSVYLAVRDGWRSIQHRLEFHQQKHCAEHYYKVRSVVPACRFERAARFIYLNRTCWNGLYRVNLKGEFNVPIGTKTTVLQPTDDFLKVSSLLRESKIASGDFAETISASKKGDLIFADPPYVAQENSATFRKYHTSKFTWADQVRLRDELVSARRRGVRVVLLNANTESLRKLYSAHFAVDFIDVRNTMAASAVRRGRRSELIAVA